MHRDDTGAFISNPTNRILVISYLKDGSDFYFFHLKKKRARGFLRDGFGVLLFVFPLLEPWIKKKIGGI